MLALEQKQQELARKMADFDKGITTAQRAADIKSYAELAGGIAQVGSAIMQVQNLGSIWANADLSLGEKLLQTITNLAISLPMLTNGLRKAASSMGLMQIFTKE